MRHLNTFCRLLPLAIASLPFSAQAQTPPSAGDVLKQLPIQPPVVVERSTLPAIGGAPVEPPMTALPSGPSVEVKTFALSGNREIATDTLLLQIAGEAGKSFTLPQMEALATRLTRYYRSQGYFVARVYVPRQEVTEGIVTLRVVEGNYGKFVLDNNSLVRDEIVQGMLDDVKKYDIVSLDTLERAMNIINDTPGAKVIRADVMPGEAVGTSDFSIGTKADPVHQGFILVDNHGSRYTGRERVSFNWDWNSPTRSGDRLSVSGLGSSNSNLLNGRVGYSTSLAPSGWRGEVAVSQTNYELGDSFKALDALGYAKGFDLGVTYPIRRITAQTIEAGLMYSYKDLKDEIRSTNVSTPKATQALMASLSLRDEARLWGLDGVTQATASLTAGNLDIRETTARNNDQAAAGPHTQGSYSKLNLSLSRVSVLPEQFSLTGSLRWQESFGKNLDGSERMGIAGVSGVMAYPSGELSGSNALVARLELSRPLPSLWGLKHQWSVLADWGEAKAVDTDKRRNLSDIGIGYFGKHDSGFMVKAYMTQRMSDPATSEPYARNKFLVQAGYLF